MNVPVDSRLPNSGAVISGLPDLNPDKLGQIRNVVKDSSLFGAQIEHWDGFDVTANGRFNKLTIQGGVSAGRRLTDNCEVRAKVPEAALATVIGLPSPLTTPYCRVSEPMLTQIKGSASYVLPWYDVRISGTLQSVTGPVVAANNLYQCAEGCTWPGLGRPFSSGSALVNLIQNGALYGDRLNQVDLRFTKILKFGARGSVDLDVDLYNAFNSRCDPVAAGQLRRGLAERHQRDPAAVRQVPGQMGLLGAGSTTLPIGRSRSRNINGSHDADDQGRSDQDGERRHPAREEGSVPSMLRTATTSRVSGAGQVA